MTATEEFVRAIQVDDLDADPYPIYARLRREAPVAYVPSVDTWFVTRFADVQTVAERSDLFPATHGESPVEITFGKPAIIAVEGDVHHELRRSFDGKFRPRTVEGYIDGLVRPLALAAVEGLRGRSEAELMAEYFEPISVSSLAEVLGLGDLGPDVLRRWFKGMSVGATNFERDPAKQAVADAVCSEIDSVVVPRMERLSAKPDDSTMAQLLHSGREAAGCPRDIEFVLPSLKVAILGGMQEPGHGAGSILAGLFTRPDQLAQVVADPAASLPAAVDEGLRWIAPIGTQLRRAAVDVELGGAVVPAGASVSAVLASANRDEAVFDAPDTFDLTRYTGGRTPQAAFGFGKHFCSGHSFSRHQMRIALEVLVEAFPALAPAPDQAPRFFGWEFRAPADLHVRLGDGRS